MKIFTTFFLLFIFFNTYAQVGQEPISSVESSEDASMKVESKASIAGKVLELGTGKPIEGASTQLLAVTADNLDKDSLITITLTRTNGDFSFTSIPDYDSLLVIVSSVGHNTEMRYIRWKDHPSGKYEIGNITLAREAQQLAGVVITAQRPQMQLGIDKKVFDASQDLNSKGGTAVDLMKSIPSLTVDVDGNVTFRDNTPTIYIDGRPTTLTLEQIPSDDIDRIELVSNPSAKYEATSGGGIINIILKKDRANGLNGLVSVSGGVPGIFRSNVNLNIRQNKINFFVSGGYNTSGGKSKGSSFRESKDDAGKITSLFDQHYVNKRNREFKYIRGGFDYFIDNRNTLSLQQGYTQGDFTNYQVQDQKYSDANDVLQRYGDRISDNASRFHRNNSQMHYTHTFPESGHKLDAALTVNYGGMNTEAAIVNSFFNPDDSQIGNPQVVNNEGKNNSTRWTAQVDYTKPLGEHAKIETGLRSDINNYLSVFNSFNIDHGNKIKLPLSNNYKYGQQIHAAYFTYTNQLGSFGYQLGMRGEYTRFEGTLIDSARSFGYTYPASLKHIWDALFPSVFLSQKISDKDELQLNYSRRTRRPSIWQLNPFIDINDPQNIQQGNPELRPEFTNSLEFNYSKTYGQGSNLLVTLYYRNTLGDITQFSDTLTAEQYSKLESSAVDPDAILNTYINARSRNNTGLEVVLKQRIVRGWDVTPSFDVAYRVVNASANNLNLSRNGAFFRAKLQSTYTLRTANDQSVFNNMAFQASARYRSSMLIPQGKRLPVYSMDLSVKKDLFKDKKGSLVLGINDVFDSWKMGIIYDTPTYYQKSYNRWRTRGFRLSFSYRFGDSNFQLFNKDRRGGNGDDFDA